MRLLLASASPRRRDLLAAAGLAFDVEPSRVDEDFVLAPESPRAAALELAARKALSVAARHAGEDVLVLGADTIVAVGGEREFELLGKPLDADDERRMLRLLSGTRHLVVTGVCVVACGAAPAGSPPTVHADAEATFVTMRALSPEDIEDYVASGEWTDKAGGYAIQEGAEGFVTRLEGGGFDNVVGLPVRLALELIARARDESAGGG
jgi:septum formation protein